jgi:chromosome partitioning protein
MIINMSPYVITIAQQKGGAGKSTIATHLAVAFAKLKKKVVLIDTDPQHTVTNWHDIRSQENSKYNIACTTSTGWKVANEIAKFKDYDIILIDSPPHMETETKAAIRSADLVLVPCQPSPNDFWSTSDTLQIVEKEEKPMALILNRCPYQSKLLKQIEVFFPEKLTKFFIGNRVAFASAMLKGLTSIETEPNSTASREILQIAENLYNLIK